MNAHDEFSLYREALLFLVTAGVMAPLFLRHARQPRARLCARRRGARPLSVSAGWPARAPWLDGVLLTNVETIDQLAEFGVVDADVHDRARTVVRASEEPAAPGVRPGAGATRGLDRADRRRGSARSGRSPRAAIVFGAALSLSSTAIVVPVLAEAKLLTSAGRALQLRGAAVPGSGGRAAAVHGFDADGAGADGIRAGADAHRRAGGAGGRRA